MAQQQYLYETTHPWITFGFDFGKLNPRTWMLMGEAHSKCSHIAGVSLAPHLAEDLHIVSLTKSVLGTAAIEGNTLSLNQVQDIVEGHANIPESREYQKIEIEKIISTYNWLVNEADQDLSVELLKEINLRMIDGTHHEEDAIPGQFRLHPVGVGGHYLAAPAEDCDYLAERLVDWLNSDDFAIAETWAQFPIAMGRALLAHLYIAWIHPFGDGNGRTARAIELFLLMKSGVSLPVAHLLSDHYNLTLDEYRRVLARTSQDQFPVEQFFQYAMQGFVDGQTAQLTTIGDHQLELAWRDYVHATLSGDTKTVRRQRRIALELWKHKDGPVDLLDIRYLSSKILEEYFSGNSDEVKTKRTVKRDMNKLEKLGLVYALPPGGYYANVDRVRAFMPRREDGPVGAPLEP